MAGETILIIEDDPTMLRGLRDNFEHQGYRVETAADGEQGYEAALLKKPDLIVLDIMLPKINGYEVCRRIREEGVEAPIIMLTAKGQEADIVLGLNLGADDYVTKPFSIRELLARARAFLRRLAAASLPSAPRVRFGECELDIVSHKLFCRGVEVELTPKEFRLLAFLVERAGRALTRETILKSVWGWGIIVTGRSVDRCVNTLRAKIEPDPRRPTHLQTVREIGYRFEGIEARGSEEMAERGGQQG